MSTIDEIKLLTLGNASVGKSSIILKYTDNIFDSNSLSTLGVDFKQKKIKLKNGNIIKLQIYDTAGQERFKSVSHSFIKKAEGVILMYDIGFKQSFEAIDNWFESIKENGKENLPIILVGNKCDLPDIERQVTKQEGENKANEFKIPFYETSCKEGINVQEVFDKLVENIAILKNNKVIINEFKISKTEKQKKKKKCC